MPRVETRGSKINKEVNKEIEPRNDELLVLTLCRSELYYHDLQIS